MTAQTFVCERCHKEFTRNVYPSRSNHVVKYCSKECQQHGTITTRACERCGKLFHQNDYASRKPRKYCSVECSRNPVPTHTCKQCGITFKAYITTNRPTPQFCSQECFKIYTAKRSKLCEVCGKDFVGQNSSSRFCSIECRVKGTVTKYTDEQKQHAIEIFALHGSNKASELTGISPGYIAYIAKRSGVSPNQELRINRFRDNPTKLELKLYRFLDDLDVRYVPQARIGRYIVDALINDHIIIEADGDYWHGHPRFEPLTARQKRQIGMDNARDTYFTQRGYIVIRIWECEMSQECVRDALSAFDQQ